ncbi:DUF3168 domain-containing protein [Oceanobacter sp. 3_MG-2023]|uniref:tail completion protein gp17 n=1 Tax=Oceanobacter sp. 3_MG-2023 TaxID=3062622 RepID=UPI002736A0C2|nr:DUF3168 domain-containing protein [Oceanobacter sp. 3_MG-2023]MDP2505385.1 DUF3168 domain-containing protein [Oceanobacter sp. 3_MG-2023]
MLEAILIDMLTSSAPAAIANAVADRVHPGVLPERCRYPAIRLANISNPMAERRSDGTQHTTKTSTFQLDVYARTYLAAKQLADDIAELLDGYQATHDTTVIQLIAVTNIRPGWESGTEHHNHTLDITILWSNS